MSAFFGKKMQKRLQFFGLSCNNLLPAISGQSVGQPAARTDSPRCVDELKVSKGLKFGSSLGNNIFKTTLEQNLKVSAINLKQVIQNVLKSIPIIFIFS